MQAIGEVYGARVVAAQRIMHGKPSAVTHDGKGVFESLPSPLSVIRYHSLAIVDLPAVLEVTATSGDEEIMGVRHRDIEVEGVQFHPESILSEGGKQMVSNWLKRCGA
jgi:anthranilate synthase/aminodeoxychorismate synthase-like glutamine amidotransferase